MKTLSMRVGQWSVVVCTTVALMATPRVIFGAAPDSNLKSDAADSPPVQVVKPATGSLPANYKPSPSLEEVIKLAQSGVSDEVLLAFIQNSKKEFNPSPDDIIFLNDLGVSEGAIAALIRAKPSGATPPAAVATAPTNPAPTTTGSVPIYTAPTAPQLNGVVAQPAPDAPAPPTVVVVQPPPEQQVTVTQFYDTLAPYGNWVYVANYGYCWQPTVAVVDVGWRPYAHRGHWVFTDCGWYWQSDYSWGWAPFHYGRWWRHPHSGWLWTPDTVWGPSWVSWRRHDDYCGWAPLPPAAHFRPGVGFSFHGGSVGVGFDFGLSLDFFTFVPTRHFVDRRPYAYAVPRSQVTQVYNRSTVVNNYTTINKTTVVNNGIDRKFIAKSVSKPITPVTLREGSPHTATARTAERGARIEPQPALYRTQLTTPRPEKVQHVMTELKQHASRVEVTTPGKSPGAVSQPISRTATPNPGFRPRSEPSIPKAGPAPSPRVTTETPPKPKMSDERVNQYINELKSRKETRTQPNVAQPSAPAAGRNIAPATTQNRAPVTVQPAPRKNVAVAPPQQPHAAPQQQQRIVTPVPQQPVVQQPKAVEAPQKFHQRAEQPHVVQPPQGRQPTFTPPSEVSRGSPGRQSAPVYVPPPNPPRNESAAPSRSSGSENSGRSQNSGGGRGERNDRK